MAALREATHRPIDQPGWGRWPPLWPSWLSSAAGDRMAEEFLEAVLRRNADALARAGGAESQVVVAALSRVAIAREDGTTMTRSQFRRRCDGQSMDNCCCHTIAGALSLSRFRP